MINVETRLTPLGGGEREVIMVRKSYTKDF